MLLRLLLGVCLCSQFAALPGQSSAQSTAEAKGARVSIPVGWTANKPVAVAGGPISLSNFNGAYDRGGIVPPGGAEIEITSVPIPANLTGYIRTELKGTGLGALEEAVENSKAGIRVTYTETLASDIQLVTVAFYLPRGPMLYKFYLTYRAGNKSEQELRLLFSTVIGGAQLR